MVHKADGTNSRGSGAESPIEIELGRAGGPRQPLGRPLAFSVQVSNLSDEPIWLVGVLPGSDGRRYPQYVPEIQGPAGPVQVQSPEALDYVRGLRPEDFVLLAPGESFDPQGKGFIPIQPLAWFRPSEPGTYRFRLRFDSTGLDPRDWMGHTHVPQMHKVEGLIKQVPKVQVWSNTLEIEFA
jgi:hypothetical protein